MVGRSGNEEVIPYLVKELVQDIGHWASGSGGLNWDKLTIYQGSKFHTLYLYLVSFADFKYGGCTRVLRVWEQDYELTGTKWLMRNIPQLHVA